MKELLRTHGVEALLEYARVETSVESVLSGEGVSKESAEETLEMLARSPLYSTEEKKRISKTLSRTK